MTIFTETDAAHYLGIDLPHYTTLAVNRRVPRTISLARIRQLVAEEFGVTDEELTGGQRAAYIVRPRQAIYWLAKKHTKLSLPAIGRHLGGRDHTTVLYGVKRCADIMEWDADYCARVGMLERWLCNE